MEGEKEGCLLKWTDLHFERKLTVKGVSSDFFFLLWHLSFQGHHFNFRGKTPACGLQMKNPSCKQHRIR